MCLVKERRRELEGVLFFFIIQNFLHRYNITKSESFVKILYQLLHNIYNCDLEDMENLIDEGNSNAFTDTLSE